LNSRRGPGSDARAFSDSGGSLEPRPNAIVAALHLSFYGFLGLVFRPEVVKRRYVPDRMSKP
jgi:hypothetical protein